LSVGDCHSQQVITKTQTYEVLGTKRKREGLSRDIPAQKKDKIVTDSNSLMADDFKKKRGGGCESNGAKYYPKGGEKKPTQSYRLGGVRRTNPSEKEIDGFPRKAEARIGAENSSFLIR